MTSERENAFVRRFEEFFSKIKTKNVLSPEIDLRRDTFCKLLHFDAIICGFFLMTTETLRFFLILNRFVSEISIRYKGCLCKSCGCGFSAAVSYTPGRRMPFLISFYCTLKKFRVSQG